MVWAKRKGGRTTKKLLTLTLTCAPCFSWRQGRRLRITCIHFASYLRVCPYSNVNTRNANEQLSGETEITFNRQGCGRNSELMHKLQIQVAERVSHDVTMHCVKVRRQAPKDTGDSFTRTYFISKHPKMC